MEDGITRLHFLHSHNVYVSEIENQIYAQTHCIFVSECVCVIIIIHLKNKPIHVSRCLIFFPQQTTVFIL